MRSRSEAASAACWLSSSLATSGGGGGGGVPRICCKIHCPRFTGDVRFGFDVSVSTLACVSTPPRRRSAKRHPAGTRRP